MGTPTPSRPDPSEYAAAYEPYIRLVPAGDILTHLEQQIEDSLGLLRDVTESEAETRHAPIPGASRRSSGISSIRRGSSGFVTLRFARQDRAELPGFDENEYVQNARFDARTLVSLAQEFELVRRSHLLFFRGLDGEAWLRSGVANGQSVTVRALAHIIAGHERHHAAILHQRLSR